MLDRPKAMERSVLGLSDQFTRDARRWANAEIALLRAELDDLRRRCMLGAFLALAALAVLISGLTILAQVAVAFAAPYLGSPGLAGLIVGAVLLAIVALLVKAAQRTLAWRGDNLLARLFSGARSRS